MKINNYVSKIKQVIVKYQESMYFNSNITFNVLLYHYISSNKLVIEYESNS